MIKKRNFFIFALIFAVSSSVFTMKQKPILEFDSPLGKGWAEYYRNQQVPAGKQQVYRLDPSYPKGGTVEEQRAWLLKNKNSKGWSVLAPVKRLMTSQAPAARYTRYGLAIAALGTVLFFPEQVGQLLLKNNIYYSLYQGISNGTIGDCIGSIVNAPVLNVLSVAYPYLLYKGIKGAVKPVKDAVSRVKTNLSQAKNWCSSWFTEPR